MALHRPPTHQTVRLTPGAHARPQDGVCALELASMLADERFSDRPPSVCPVLREFLHGYNDNLPDALRQDLYGVVSAVVGTRAPAHTMAWRARLITGWAQSQAALKDLTLPYSGRTLADSSLAGRRCAELAWSDPWFHRQTVAFVMWLARPSRPRATQPTPAPRSAPPLQPAPLLGQPDRLPAVARVELLHH